MPKLGMGTIRRRQLIDATIQSLHEEGFANTTLAQIGRRAGLSTGIVAHYFRDKAGLLEATMRNLAEGLRLSLVTRLKSAETPEDRLLAIIEANFSEEQSTPQVVAAWLSFWSQVGYAPVLRRIQRVYEARTRSNLVHALKSIVPPEAALELADGLAAFIDGLWLRYALNPRSDGPEHAKRLAQNYIAMQLAVRGYERSAQRLGYAILDH